MLLPNMSVGRQDSVRGSPRDFIGKGKQADSSLRENDARMIVTLNEVKGLLFKLGH